jgi:hypothetical protein
LEVFLLVVMKKTLLGLSIYSWHVFTAGWKWWKWWKWWISVCQTVAKLRLLTFVSVTSSETTCECCASNCTAARRRNDSFPIREIENSLQASEGRHITYSRNAGFIFLN